MTEQRGGQTGPHVPADKGTAQAVYIAALDIVRARLDDRKTLNSEFRHVMDLDETITHSVDDSQLPPHLPLNRYWNILPYDYNRVQTDKTPYVNASHMSLPDRIRGRVFRYIATQGPLPNTARDFWHMVLTLRVPCVIMLTGVVESGTVKCAPYFPTSPSETMDLGKGLTVTCTAVVKHMSDAHVTTRTLTITDTSTTPADTLTTTHYQFHAWPDHGTPKDGQAILQICRTLGANRCQPPQLTQPSSQGSSQGHAAPQSQSGSVSASEELTTPGVQQQPQGATQGGGVGAGGPEAVVHCSAGIGRTGTFLAIDVMRERLHTLAATGATSRQISTALDLPTLVHELRQQRMYSVQTFEQYAFIYKALKEELEGMLEQLQGQGTQQAGAVGARGPGAAGGHKP